MEEKKLQENIAKTKISFSLNMEKIKIFLEPVFHFFKDKNNSGKLLLSFSVISIV